MQEIGVFSDISNEDYHSGEGVSNSGLSAILESPRHYFYRYLSNTFSFDQTDDMKLGTQFHTLVLEPHRFDYNYLVKPKVDRRTKVYKDYFIEADSRDIIFDSDYEKLDLMKRAIHEDDLASRLLSRQGKAEHSVYWYDEQDTLCRIRPDFFTDNYIVDLKTTRDVSPKGFTKSIKDFGYHRQAAFYIDGMNAVTNNHYDHTSFYFVAVNKTPPFICQVYTLTRADIEQGRREYKQALRTYQQCKANGIWPTYRNDSYSDGFMVLELPYHAHDDERRRGDGDYFI